jgi:hypothetical protein
MQNARWKQRVFGAALALAVQVVFLLLVLLPPSRPLPLTRLSRETILFFRPLPTPKSSIIDARAPRKRHSIAPAVLPASPPVTVPPATATPLAPPSGMAGFGRSLFGCAPEQYASLTDEERSHCPKPGEGLAINRAPDLMHTRSHVKDEAHWRQEWARVHSPALLPCGGFVDLLCLVMKIKDGTLSDYGDPSTWPTYAVKQLSDTDFQKVEDTYKAWNKDHPVK